MGCCSSDPPNDRRYDSERQRRVTKFAKSVYNHHQAQALEDFSRLMLFYRLGSKGMTPKKHAPHNSPNDHDDELDLLGLCAMPPGLGCRDRTALFIARFWSRFFERMLPIPCKRQAGLGFARALYAATGAVTATLINILIMTLVCALAGTPMFVWRGIVWLIIYRPMLCYIPVIGAFLNFKGQPMTRGAHRVEAYLILRSELRAHDASTAYIDKESRHQPTRYEATIMGDIEIDYKESFLTMVAGKAGKKVDANAAESSQGCCCFSCC